MILWSCARKRKLFYWDPKVPYMRDHRPLLDCGIPVRLRDGQVRHIEGE